MSVISQNENFAANKTAVFIHNSDYFQTIRNLTRYTSNTKNWTSISVTPEIALGLLATSGPDGGSEADDDDIIYRMETWQPYVAGACAEHLGLEPMSPWPFTDP